VHREFRLDIETDSTIRMDDDAEKTARVELVTAVGNFLDKAVAAGSAAPEIVKT
jgi:sensor histidine kinase regulating citrate/malate metabolism